MKKLKIYKNLNYFLPSFVFLGGAFFVLVSCGSTHFGLNISRESQIGIANAKKLKKIVNSPNLIELSPENNEKIYENKDAKFFLFDLNSAVNGGNNLELMPEFTTKFSPKTEITYLNFINRYYNTRQLQQKKKSLNQDSNSIYIPHVDEKFKDFWYVFMIPTSIGFSTLELNGKKTVFDKKKTKLPNTLIPYSSVEVKILKKGIISADKKNYLQINVNQMINSFAFREKKSNEPNSSEINVFGFQDNKDYPNYKLIFDSLDSSKKIIKFKLHRKNDNLREERSAKNELNSYISVMNFIYKAKEYKQNLNPDDFFEKNTEQKDKNSEYPFVRFYTQTFIVPFEAKEEVFDSNFSILIEKFE